MIIVYKQYYYLKCSTSTKKGTYLEMGSRKQIGQYLVILILHDCTTTPRVHFEHTVYYLSYVTVFLVNMINKMR